MNLGLWQQLLVKEGQHGALFKWVAILTGSKNALKGAGFFVGGLLLGWIGFRPALVAMAAALLIVWIMVQARVTGSLGKAKTRVRLSHLFAKSKAINTLSAARFFLFGSRDIWFVVGLPIYLSAQLNWSYTNIGAFLAAWVIGYGFVQILAPKLIPEQHRHKATNASRASFALAVCLAAMLFSVWNQWSPLLTIIAGLTAYGFVFAINSSIHSYLVLAYGRREQISMDVGFYYMANAAGRLTGTLLSGWLYQAGGLTMCLSGSLVFAVLSWLLAARLPEFITGGNAPELSSRSTP